jgi:hypothetical protein
VTIPNHRSLRIGTLASILADIAAQRGIDKEALITQLWD